MNSLKVGTARATHPRHLGPVAAQMVLMAMWKAVSRNPPPKKPWGPALGRPRLFERLFPESGELGFCT